MKESDHSPAGEEIIITKLEGNRIGIDAPEEYGIAKGYHHSTVYSMAANTAGGILPMLNDLIKYSINIYVGSSFLAISENNN